MGCFWGVERIFWKQPGVWTTAVGYMGGYTPNPDLRGDGDRAHRSRRDGQGRLRPREDERRAAALKAFWENHDPTTANRQGNDVGTTYRSAIYWTTPEQERAAVATREAFQKELDDHGYGQITTEIRPAAEVGTFWLAEDYHQGYLHKNPGGYCNQRPQRADLPRRAAEQGRRRGAGRRPAALRVLTHP